MRKGYLFLLVWFDPVEGGGGEKVFFMKSRQRPTICFLTECVSFIPVAFQW